LHPALQRLVIRCEEDSWIIREVPIAALLGFLIGLINAAWFWAVTFFEDYMARHLMAYNKWHWMYLTTAGGLVSGVLALRWRTFGTSSSSFWDVLTRNEEWKNTAYGWMAATVALISGAPLSPEVAWSAVAWTGAAIMARMTGSGHWRWVASSAALGGLLPTSSGIVLGPLLVQELSLYAGRGEAARSEVTLRVLMLQVVASAAASCTAPWFFPTHDFAVPSNEPFKPWHVAMAVPFGLMCGSVGCCVGLVHSIFRHLQSKGREFYRGTAVGDRAPAILFPVFAGLVHGWLACSVSSYATGSGLSLLTGLWKGETILSTNQLLKLAFARVVGMGACTGFGLVGGQLLPTAVVGLCVGLLLAGKHWTVLPVGVVVPCCVAACPAALCPAPLAAVLTVILVLGASPHQAGPMMMASVVAWFVAGSWKRWEEPLVTQEQTASQRLSRSSSAEEDDEILRSVRSQIFGSNP
jgi:hypothetical protein